MDIREILEAHTKEIMAGADKASSGSLAAEEYEGVTPPGMEHVVKKLKKEPGVTNPWALAWWLKKRQKAKGMEAATILETPGELETALTEYQSLSARGHFPEVCVYAADGKAWAQAALMNEHLMIYQEPAY